LDSALDMVDGPGSPGVSINAELDDMATIE
jgi:hypothetical protein